MAVAVLASCSDKEELRPETELHPIAFSSVEAEQGMMTRSATTLGRDFVVYGYKYMNSTPQMVFSGYTVKYEEGSANTSEDNTHNYSYVDGNQTIKYWDFSASEYRYWGYTGDKSNLSDDGKQLTIPVSGLLSASEPTSIPFYSSLYIRKSPVKSDVVRLEFKRPYSKIRVQFYTNDPLDANDEIPLTDITFAPEEGKKIYKSGTVEVTYSLDKATETVKAIPTDADAQERLAYQDVTLTPSAGYTSDHAVTAKTAFSTDLYYTLPMDEQNPAFIMTACVNGDTEKKTAVVPANFMQWKPNFIYTYIFKITEAGKKIEFYDVKIDPWKYGGSQKEEWRNW